MTGSLGQSKTFLSLQSVLGGTEFCSDAHARCGMFLKTETR